MFQEISPILLIIFRGVRHMMKKQKQFLNQKIRTFPCVNSFDSSACPQTQTIDGRRQTEGGRRYMTGTDPEIQS